jgi:hypothetical protein
MTIRAEHRNPDNGKGKPEYDRSHAGEVCQGNDGNPGSGRFQGDIEELLKEKIIFLIVS